MGIFSIIRRHRRAVMLGTLIVLLHAMLFSLIGSSIALPRLPGGLSDTRFVQAELLPDAAPEVAPPVPIPAPQSLPPPPLPELATELPEPAPLLAEDAVAPPVEPGAGGLGDDMLADMGVVREAKAILAAGEPAPPKPEPAPEPQPAPPVPEPRSYKVSLPPSSAMTMDVARVDRDGTRWSGEAQLTWQQEGERYRIAFEAGIRVVFTRVNLAVLTSEGTVASTGFAPVKMTEKRRGRALTATHFDWENKKISFSASQKNVDLAAGAQDKASVPLQLTAIARGDPAQLTGEIDIQVGEERDAVVYRFVVVGQEEIDTKLGKLQTVHLSRPPKEGSYRSRLDIWLAPSRGWYPVQSRSTEANGAVTTQTVNNIALTATGK
ncbi:DUF3108 domain-containing protein [Massilia niabensis]|uniref:DUF3108 domain-containing protein n=1 Tax=Massilia niabensis TaxID=544910 RepID=A0ABW0L1T7_9BURK